MIRHWPVYPDSVGVQSGPGAHWRALWRGWLPWLALVVWLLLCLLPGAVAGKTVPATGALDVVAMGESVELKNWLDVLEDPDGKLTLSEVMQRRFTPAAAVPHLNFGYTGKAYWLRLTLENRSGQTLQRMLEIGEARLSQVDFYQLDADGVWQAILTGNVQPFASRPYPNRYFVFPLQLAPHGRQQVVLRVQSLPPLIIPATLWRPDPFHHAERNLYWAQAWYFGMATAMIVFNLLLYVALREVLYLLYAWFATLFATTMAVQTGLAKQFLWQDSPVWSDVANGVGYGVSMAVLLLFMRQMLQTRQRVPRMDRLLRWQIGLVLLLPVLMLFRLQWAFRLGSIWYAVTAVMIVGVALWCGWRGQRSAVWFVLAFAVLMCSGLATTLRVFGYLPVNILTTNGTQIGSALEMLLLALALADRLKTILQERARARSEAFSAQQQLVENLQASERQLELRVAERSRELEQSNRELSDANTALTGALREAETARQQAVLAQQQAHAALQELSAAEAQLVQSEKSAALGQLIGGVTREIAMPIMTLKRSGKQIADCLDKGLSRMPYLFRELGTEHLWLFQRMVAGASLQPAARRRQRRLRQRRLMVQLAATGLSVDPRLADFLVRLHADVALADYVVLLRHERAEMIVESAWLIARIMQLTCQINRAVVRVSTAIAGLRRAQSVR